MSTSDPANNNQSYIGTAEMEPDGTIVLHLRAAHGSTVGHGTLTYGTTHPQYYSILQHIGELKPGETMLVTPWDDSD